MVAPFAAGDAILISGEPVSEGCTAAAGTTTQQTTVETPWRREYATSEDGKPILSAVKSVVIRFSGRNTQEVAAGDGAAGNLEIEDCTAGACVVEIHVYAESVTTTRTGVGVLGFLPWFFAVGGMTQVEEKVSTREESKISCEGAMWTALDFTGGVGPQIASATILRKNNQQEHGSCSDSNLPSIDDSCTILFKGPFEIKASTPGRYTRFDVMNGGFYDQGTATDVGHNVIVSGVCIPRTRIASETMAESIELDRICLGEAGEYRLTFASIEIDVDTTDAEAFLYDAPVPGPPDPFSIVSCDTLTTTINQELPVSPCGSRVAETQPESQASA